MSVRELVELSTAQRAALVAAAGPIADKLGKVDRVLGYVRRYPLLTSVLVGAVALAGPQKVFALGARALTLYSLLRK